MAHGGTGPSRATVRQFRQRRRVPAPAVRAIQGLARHSLSQVVRQLPSRPKGAAGLPGVRAVVKRNRPTFRAEGPQLYARALAHNKPFAKLGPYQTALPHHQEHQFRKWVKQNRIPFDPGAKVTDYDMRGLWLSGGKRAASGHFPDTFKTPYDTTFSRQSKYATPNDPFDWQGDRLIDQRTGQVVFSPLGRRRPPSFASILRGLL